MKVGHFFCTENEIADRYASEVGALAFAVYLILRRFADRNGECTIKESTIAARLALCEKTVSNCLTKLAKKKLVECIRRPNRASTYCLLPVGIETSEPNHVPNQLSLEPNHVPNQLPLGTELDSEPTVPEPNNIPIPIRKKSLKTKSKATSKSKSIAQPAVERKRVASSAIEEIYQAYPRHVGKQDALKKIAKAIEAIASRFQGNRAEAAAWLLGRVEIFARSPAVTQSETQYIKHPATWMYKGCFDDDPQQWGVFPANGKPVQSPDPPKVTGNPDCPQCHGSGWKEHPGHPGREVRCGCSYSRPWTEAAQAVVQ